VADLPFSPFELFGEPSKGGAIGRAREGSPRRHRAGCACAGWDGQPVMLAARWPEPPPAWGESAGP